MPGRQQAPAARRPAGRHAHTHEHDIHVMLAGSFHQGAPSTHVQPMHTARADTKTPPRATRACRAEPRLPASARLLSKHRRTETCRPACSSAAPRRRFTIAARPTTACSTLPTLPYSISGGRASTMEASRLADSRLAAYGELASAYSRGAAAPASRCTRMNWPGTVYASTQRGAS